MIYTKKITQGVLFTPNRRNTVHIGSTYPRVIEIRHGGKRNGRLVATLEHCTKKVPEFPVFESVDGGYTWKQISSCKDTINGFGNRFQPFLGELDRDVADLKAGTLLLSGLSVPVPMMTTEITLYVSRDGGRSWEARGSVAKGGEARERNFGKLGPVWEPFLCVDKYGDLVCYYTDERDHDEGYNQQLVYQVSRDGGKTWEEKQRVVALKEEDDIVKGDLETEMRPGMPIVAKTHDGYFMCYEIVGRYHCEIYCKTSPDGLDWGDPYSPGERIETRDKLALASMPYCVFTPTGGEKGTVIVGAKREAENFDLREPGYFHVNYNGGKGEWFRVEQPIAMDIKPFFAGYSPGMCTFDNESKIIQLSPTSIDGKRMQISYAISEIRTE